MRYEDLFHQSRHFGRKLEAQSLFYPMQVLSTHARLLTTTTSTISIQKTRQCEVADAGDDIEDGDNKIDERLLLYYTTKLLY